MNQSFLSKRRRIHCSCLHTKQMVSRTSVSNPQPTHAVQQHPRAFSRTLQRLPLRLKNQTREIQEHQWAMHALQNQSIVRLCQDQLNVPSSIVSCGVGQPSAQATQASNLKDLFLIDESNLVDINVLKTPLYPVLI